MNKSEKRTSFSLRQFVAMVRSALDAADHPEIAFRRQWIDDAPQKYPFLVHVPVGPTLSIPLRPLDNIFDHGSNEALERNSEEFALALINLKQAEKLIEKYVRGVRTAATAEIANAQAEGIDILLDSVGLTATYARQLTFTDWREAVQRVPATIKIRSTSFFLQPEVAEIIIRNPADVADEFTTIRKDQWKRLQKLAELEQLGADLVVDTLTLDLLAAHSIDAVEALRDVCRSQCINLKVQHLGRETLLSLISSGGKVTASMALEDAHWNGEFLWLRDEALVDRNSDLAGKSLGDLVRHPVFSSRPIVSHEHRHTAHFTFDLSEKVHFDAETGRIWREERLAA